ncbi:methyl-accepting chemotaxis protein [Luteimonas abyssi]|uniref:methyl-accepting chemotaxis protein n=1 Tax=Luteimonas abyssi TaxID=1247514 RepID=UPI000737B392|nr:methyl-accepting chemotaxis protein [Luteimonas abyssi]
MDTASRSPLERLLGREASPYLHRLATDADRLFVGVGALLGLASLAIAAVRQDWLPFVAASLPTLAVLGAVRFAIPGTVLARCAIAALLMVLSATIIQQSGGMIETHFGVILLIAALLYYRDWRPIVTAAATIAIHHVAFFWLQQRGFPLLVFPAGAGIPILLLHATYVVAEAGLLTAMARSMRRQLVALGHDPDELALLASGVAADAPMPPTLRGTRFPDRSLAHALCASVERLGTQREEERRLLRENLRIRAALDHATTHIMLADAARDIVYVNRPLQTMLEAAQPDIARDIPDFDARTLVGRNIDLFHRSPQRQARMLAALEGTHQAEIRVGGRIMRLIINPIVDDSGARLGFVVEWTDRTAEIRVEEEIERIVRAAAAGDLQGRIGTHDKQGFLLRLTERVNTLLDANAHSIEGISVLLDALAQGDLAARIDDDDAHGIFARMRDDANRTVCQLAGIVTGIQSAAGRLRTAADGIVGANRDLDASTRRQDALLGGAAQRLHALTTTVHRNAEHAGQAERLAAEAMRAAEDGGVSVDDMVASMRGIEQASSRIADITALIDGIAFQTNLLSLNAAVEAARAGEHGRGFAVVAGEVRELARRCANAAREIRSLIGTSSQAIESGVERARHAGDTMQGVVASVDRVVAIMAAISEASGAQSTGIDAIERAIADVGEATVHGNALVAEATASAEAMRHDALQLGVAVAAFRLGEPDTAGAAETTRAPAMPA